MSFLDIPRDESAADEAGPRLPKKIDDLDDVEIISVGNDVDCFEERDPGTCLNSHEAWFYDPTHNKCHFFIYSGCGGNSNRQDLNYGPNTDKNFPLHFLKFSSIAKAFSPFSPYF